MAVGLGQSHLTDIKRGSGVAWLVVRAGLVLVITLWIAAWCMQRSWRMRLSRLFRIDGPSTPHDFGRCVAPKPIALADGQSVGRLALFSSGAW